MQGHSAPNGPATREELYQWPYHIRDALFGGDGGDMRLQRFLDVTRDTVMVASDMSGFDVQGEALRLMWEACPGIAKLPVLKRRRTSDKGKLQQRMLLRLSEHYGGVMRVFGELADILLSV